MSLSLSLSFRTALQQNFIAMAIGAANTKDPRKQTHEQEKERGEKKKRILAGTKRRSLSLSLSIHLAPISASSVSFSFSSLTSTRETKNWIHLSTHTYSIAALSAQRLLLPLSSQQIGARGKAAASPFLFALQPHREIHPRQSSQRLFFFHFAALIFFF